MNKSNSKNGQGVRKVQIRDNWKKNVYCFSDVASLWALHVST